MLEEIRVLNGELSPKYDKYNNKYTIKISEDVTKIKFEFVKSEGTEVSVYGNDNLKDGDNYLVLSITNNGQKEYIYINVIKESKAVTEIIDNAINLEVANSIPIYVGPLISLLCFLIILSLFILLFWHKKKG